MADRPNPPDADRASRGRPEPTLPDWAKVALYILVIIIGFVLAGPTTNTVSPSDDCPHYGPSVGCW